MYNFYDHDDHHNYSPGEMYFLSVSDPIKYNLIISSNLENGETLDEWKSRQMKELKDNLYKKLDG